MKHITRISTVAIVMAFVSQGVSHGSIQEVGDLNIINMSGNPSDGLRYLDMTFSDGLTQADALANAQATYANARLATPDEFDDLFLAAGIAYNGLLTAADAFTTGSTATISNGTNYDAGALAANLGFTAANPATLIWTTPDGSPNDPTTRDILWLDNNEAKVYNVTVTPPSVNAGWLLVSDPAGVPEPSAVFVWVGLGLIGFSKLWRHRKSM